MSKFFLKYVKSNHCKLQVHSEGAEGRHHFKRIWYQSFSRTNQWNESLWKQWFWIDTKTTVILAHINSGLILIIVFPYLHFNNQFNCMKPVFFIARAMKWALIYRSQWWDIPGNILLIFQQRRFHLSGSGITITVLDLPHGIIMANWIWFDVNVRLAWSRTYQVCKNLTF